jgi:hypothetical protein
MLPEINIGDHVEMRKPHPCGGTRWVVVRLGADIGLVCLTCKHRILLSRRDLNRRMKVWLAKDAKDTEVE